MRQFIFRPRRFRQRAVQLREHRNRYHLACRCLCFILMKYRFVADADAGDPESHAGRHVFQNVGALRPGNSIGILQAV